MTATVPAEKLFVSANQLLDDAFRLGGQILDDGFRPDVLIALWRGGTPVGIAIQELLACAGWEHRHFAVKTRHYAGMATRHGEVIVEGLDLVLETVDENSNILLVDDVFDTGLTLDKVASLLKPERGVGAGEVRIATPYFKPGNNLTLRKPDYYLYETGQWIVFPHEIAGLKAREIIEGKRELPSLAVLSDRLGKA